MMVEGGRLLSLGKEFHELGSTTKKAASQGGTHVTSDGEGT